MIYRLPHGNRYFDKIILRNRNIMNNKIKCCIALLCAMNLSVYAIKPSHSYSNTPSTLNLTYEEIKISTKDGASLNVWHLPAEALKTPIVLALPDAGNMGDWVYLGMYLQAYGMDVWMFDYRGFGTSSSFEMDQQQLYYHEFITDLAAICDYVQERTTVVPALLGLSMGTIVINEYLNNCTLPIRLVVFDGYIQDPQEWVSRLAPMGKTVKLPVGYKYIPNKYKQHCLFIVEEKDTLFSINDIPQPNSKKTTVKSFNCGHISAFANFPQEYVELIQQFIYKHES